MMRTIYTVNSKIFKLFFFTGYDWVGWKRSSSHSNPKSPHPPSVSLVFAFDSVRSFSRVDLHADNHFSRDVQIFKEAKVSEFPFPRN